ncbi:myeloid differentiation primary response protein MyD88-A [Cloeon dipterum]|uniref:myeloid differentiation primary response protein MyD88-A n=1 Tax=Cloeon dipterum TaxID=197152 RepID=UPI00321FDAED
MVNQNMYLTPLSALTPATIEQLGMMLDSRKVIPTSKGHLRDWRGLAEMVGLSAVQQSALNGKANCLFTEEVLKLWQTLKDPKLPPNIGTLQDLLEEIDRWDIHDDLAPQFELDAEKYRQPVEQSQIDRKKQQNSSDREIITIDDTVLVEKGLPPQQYDVMLLYADEDYARANEILERLEERNIKVFIKNRDLIPGVFEFDAVLEMIANRCNKIVVIFSDPLFQNDKLNSFLVSYAQVVGIETDKRKIIPVTFEMCNIPSKLRFIYRVDYSNNQHWNFYDKLYNSVRPSHLPPSTQLMPRATKPSLSEEIEPMKSATSTSLDSAYLSESPPWSTPLEEAKRTKNKKLKFLKIFNKGKKKVGQSVAS